MASHRGEILPLTGVRGAAALAVVMFHIQGDVRAAWPGAEDLVAPFERGFLGVDLFFVLSGFVLTYTYAERFERPTPATVAEYAAMRLARIYPVHLATLALLLAAVIAARAQGADISEEAFSLSRVPAHLLMVHTWAGHPHDWNQPAWSVSAEWFAYLLFPALVPTVLRPRSWVWAAAVSLLCWAALAVVTERFGDGTLNLSPALPRVATEFVIGGLLTRIRPTTTLATASSLVGTLGILLVAVSSVPDWWAVPAFVALVLGLANAGTGRLVDPVAALLAWRPLVALGRASYSLYMVQLFAVLALRALLPLSAWSDASAPVAVAVVATWVGATIVAGVVTWLLVEEPARHLVRRRTASSRA